MWVYFKVFEILIRDGGIWPFNLIRNSTSIKTVCFMALSAYIMDSVQNYKLSNCFPWLIKPLNRECTTASSPSIKSWIFDYLLPTRNQCCSHPSSCDHYLLEVRILCNICCCLFISGNSICLLQGIKTFLGIGLGLEIGRSVFKNSGAFLTHPIQQMMSSIRNINWNIISFIVGYPVIYRVCFARCLIHLFLK